MNVYELFLMFIIYSFIGWSIEVVNVLIKSKKFVNRGFLMGPYCPIYGVGGVVITLLLTKYKDSVIALFVLAMSLCAVLEYFTSYLMEKIFKARWWDYSNKKFNINGRICLETMVPFGILGCISIYLLNPLIYSLFGLMSLTTLKVIAIIIFIIFVSDVIISFNIINTFKSTAITFLKKDNTEEITKKLKKPYFLNQYGQGVLLMRFQNLDQW